MCFSSLSMTCRNCLNLRWRIKLFSSQLHVQPALINSGTHYFRPHLALPPCPVLTNDRWEDECCRQLSQHCSPGRRGINENPPESHAALSVRATVHTVTTAGESQRHLIHHPACLGKHCEWLRAKALLCLHLHPGMDVCLVLSSVSLKPGPEALWNISALRAD